MTYSFFLRNLTGFILPLEETKIDAVPSWETKEDIGL